MKQHVQVVAWLNIGLSVIWLLVGTALFIILVGFGTYIDDRDAVEIMTIVAPFLAFFFFITAIPAIIGGIFLLQHKEWARILILIISFLDLVNFPIGTAVGIYAIWVLLHKETVKLFVAQPVKPQSSPQP